MPVPMGLPRSLGAAVVVIALLAGVQQYPARGGAATESAAAQAPLELPASITEWTDGLDHYVVQLHAAPDPHASPAPPATPQSARPGLRLTIPTTPEEREFLEAAGDGLQLAVDDAGGRYAVDLTDGRVVAADGPEATTPTSPLEPSATPAEAPATALAAVPGVEEVMVVAPDLLAVAVDPATDPADLARVAGVADVSEDVLLHLAGNDARFPEQWALDNRGDPAQAGGRPGVVDADLDAVEAWEVARGEGVVVAVIDTGVALGHPDLRNRLWSNPGEVCGNGVDDDANGYVDDCVGWDFGSGDDDPNPDPGDPTRNHGTHVAGIVAAEADNGVGVAGVAPDARIMALKVSRDGMLPTSALVGAIRYAAANGADIVNLSLGTPPNTPRAAVATMEAAVAAADAAGVLVLAAAGNNGVDISGEATVWPAGFSRIYPGVMAVGATTNTDDRASFSNHGTPVDVYAPGAFLLSTYADGLGWGWMSGTSMATPAAAGAAAVVLSSGVADSASAVRAALVAGADVLPGVGPRVNVARTVGARGVDGVFDLAVGGLAALRPDTPGTIRATLAASEAPDGPVSLLLAVATLEGGVAYAVGDLPVTMPDGTVLRTGEDGALPPIPVDDALATTGWTTDLTTGLPEGTYALVAEVVDASGDPLEEPVVAVFDVRPAPPTTTPSPTSPPPSSPPPSNPPPSNPPPSNPPNAPGPTTSTTSVPGPTPAPPTTTPRPPAPGSPAPTPAPPAPGPTTTAPPVTTRPPSAPAPVPTTAPPTPPPPPAPAPTTTALPPAPPPTAPAPAPAPAPTTTVAPPSGNRPVVTTPPPEPDRSGSWRLTSADPRLALTTGGTRITLTGTFPTDRPVRVRLWDVTVVPDRVTADRIEFTTPPLRADYYPITVAFDAGNGRTTELTLDHALTVLAPEQLPAPTTTTTRPPSGGGSGGGSTPTTAPVPTPTTTPVRPPSGGGSPAPTTVAPPPTTVPAPGPTTTRPSLSTSTTTAPVVVIVRGSLSLRPLAATGTLARASAVFSVATRCATDPCTARRL